MIRHRPDCASLVKAHKKGCNCGASRYNSGSRRRPPRRAAGEHDDARTNGRAAARVKGIAPELSEQTCTKRLREVQGPEPYVLCGLASASAVPFLPTTTPIGEGGCLDSLVVAADIAESVRSRSAVRREVFALGKHHGPLESAPSLGLCDGLVKPGPHPSFDPVSCAPPKIARTPCLLPPYNSSSVSWKHMATHLHVQRALPKALMLDTMAPCTSFSAANAAPSVAARVHDAGCATRTTVSPSSEHSSATDPARSTIVSRAAASAAASAARAVWESVEGRNHERTAVALLDAAVCELRRAQEETASVTASHSVVNSPYGRWCDVVMTLRNEVVAQCLEDGLTEQMKSADR